MVGEKMAREINFGIEFVPNMPPNQCADRVKLAEDNGFKYAWITDHFNNRNVYPMLTLISLKTSTIRPGTGITNPFTRNPLLTANAIATIDEVSGGRVNLGMGPGDKATFDKMGFGFPAPAIWSGNWDIKKPLSAIKEAKEVVYKLLGGNSVDIAGETIKVTGAKLDFTGPQKDKVPFYMGAQGPGMLKTAGEIADGVLINASNEKDYVAAVPNIQEGVGKSGRSMSDFDVGAYTAFSVGPDLAKARKSAKMVAAFITMGSPPPVLERHGIPLGTAKAIGAAIGAGKWGEVGPLVDDNMIDAFVIAGDADACNKKIDALLETGVTQVIIGSPTGPDVEEAIKICGTDIIPSFAGRC
jgi:5,10-methylenetetrahydromethanopterin reductase